jgi:Protein kinase domain
LNSREIKGLSSSQLNLFFKKTSKKLDQNITTLENEKEYEESKEDVLSEITYLKGNTRLHKSSNIVKSLKLRYLYQIKWFNCNNSTKSASRSLTDFKPLGEGSYAAVFSALDSELNLKVAVKVFDKRQVMDRFKRNLIQKELDLMVKIDHKNIVQLYKVLEDRIKIFFVMEFCGEKNLKKQVILKSIHTDEESNTNLLNKSDVIKIMKTLINTVAYLHKN